MSNARAIVFGGPSGSGKSTLIHELTKLPGVRLAVSATTRDPRPGEVDGVDYHFVTREAFDEMKGGDLIEWAEVHQNGYGTPRSELQRRNVEDRAVLLDIDVQGLRNLRDLSIACTSVFIAPPSMEELERRLLGRGTESPEKLAIRLNNARTEMAASDEYDHLVVNEAVKSSLTILRKLLAL